MCLDADIKETNITMISNALAVAEYYDWMVDMFVPYLGKRILEVGAGIGTISERLVRHTDTLVVSDEETDCLNIIKPKLEAIETSCRVEYITHTLGNPWPENFTNHPFDTVVVVNVLEHVPDDVSVLYNLKEVLKPGATLIVIVPAVEAIYGTLDEALGHFRRYSRFRLKTILGQAGYSILKMNHSNFLGVFGWWVNARVLKRKVVPVSNFRYFKLLFPLVKAIESRISLPFGISLLAVGVNP